MNFNKIFKKDLHKINGGLIREEFFIGYDLTVDPRGIKFYNCQTGHMGYAVYDDVTDKYLGGFFGNNSYIRAKNLAKENGVSSILEKMQ